LNSPEIDAMVVVASFSTLRYRVVPRLCGNVAHESF
jgi:hypothetical protein